MESELGSSAFYPPLRSKTTMYMNFAWVGFILNLVLFLVGSHRSFYRVPTTDSIYIEHKKNDTFGLRFVDLIHVSRFDLRMILLQKMYQI